ncbi:MAG: hypothetical protein QG575_1663 [Euryarchaeota archaeon]|nr:hypothetical protein [Euryarchaeota archaeon]
MAATANICHPLFLGPGPMPSEDPPIAELLANALQPLQDRISTLENTIVQLKEENAALTATQATLSDNQLIQLQLIKRLKEAVRREPQPMQRDRAEILRALLAANGGKMLAKEARQKMHLAKSRFSELLSVCDFLETKPLHSDRRKMIIILKSELVPRNY